jgi:hypothetical protein
MLVSFASFAAEGIVHLIFKAIEQYRRPRGMALRLDMGGRVAVLDNVNPNSAEELRELQKRDPRTQSVGGPGMITSVLAPPFAIAFRL